MVAPRGSTTASQPYQPTQTSCGPTTQENPRARTDTSCPALSPRAVSSEPFTWSSNTHAACLQPWPRRSLNTAPGKRWSAWHKQPDARGRQCLSSATGMGRHWGQLSSSQRKTSAVKKYSSVSVCPHGTPPTRDSGVWRASLPAKLTVLRGTWRREKEARTPLLIHGGS